MIYEYHTPVLLRETIHFLQPGPDKICVDGTLGGGGHAEAIAKEFSGSGQLIAFDRDADAIFFAKRRLHGFGERIKFVHDNFSRMKTQLTALGISEVDGILLDLGVSTHQLQEASRGMSFQQEARLDMRMDQNQRLDAWTVVNTYEERALARVFWEYGEERDSRKIASEIVRERQQSPIETTEELRKVIRRVISGKFTQKSLARVFQAIRIEVNGELENLSRSLQDMPALLRSGGRILVMSYHSLEDRIVKDFFKEESRTCLPSGSKYLPDQPLQPRLRIVTKKPIMAAPDEVQINSRARSAKLRVAEKV